MFDLIFDIFKAGLVTVREQFVIDKFQIILFGENVNIKCDTFLTFFN